MQDQSLILIIVAVVALALLVQAVALTGAFLVLRRLEERFARAERELRALQPHTEKLARVIDNLSDWTESAAEHVPRLAKSVESSVNDFRGVARLGAMALVKPLRPLAAALAAWKGINAGVRAYRAPTGVRSKTDSPWVSAYVKDSAK